MDVVGCASIDGNGRIVHGDGEDYCMDCCPEDAQNQGQIAAESMDVECWAPAPEEKLLKWC